MPRHYLRRPAKKRRGPEKKLYLEDEEQGDSEDSDQGANLDNADLVEAQSRLDQFIKAGAISLVSSSGSDDYDMMSTCQNPFKNPQDKDALTIEMLDYHLNSSDSDNHNVFKCVMCQMSFYSLSELSRHELFEHFTWVFKPLLMHLLDIIWDESFHCPSSSCPLRVQLVKCINSHQTSCPECHFASDCSSTLMEHYKVTTDRNAFIFLISNWFNLYFRINMLVLSSIKLTIPMVNQYFTKMSPLISRLIFRTVIWAMTLRILMVMMMVTMSCGSHHYKMTWTVKKIYLMKHS